MKPEFRRNETMCRNCIYWNVNKISSSREWNGDKVYLYESGDCRLNPPIVNLGSDGEFKCLQPETTFYDWCGQYQMNINAKIGFCSNITNKENLPYFDTTKPLNHVNGLNQ